MDPDQIAYLSLVTYINCETKSFFLRLQVGVKMLALNLSQQTDSADLLGGFRPVQAGEAFYPLVERFSHLFASTFTKGSNSAFLGRMAKFAQRGKWTSLTQAFRAAMVKVLYLTLYS